MHQPHFLRRVVSALCRTSAVATLVALVASRAGGQPPGASLWNATLTIAPAPSPFLSDWARNPTIAQLSIFYSGTTSETYRVEAIITERRRGELGRGISGIKDIAFGPASAQLTTQDLVDWAAFNYDPSLRSQIVRTGLLPEGDYQICARIRNQFGGALLTQACSDFRIQYPESPQLIAPATGSGVTVAQPTFQWVPVQAPAEAGVRYRLRIAKRLPGQAPAIALQANVPQHEGESSGAAFYVYPLDALPLDTGATYVWQVQTLTKDGVPFSAGGRPSEIWSFAWGPGGVGGPRRVADRPFSDTLSLVPGLARLRGLALVNATESDFDVRLDGAAILELTPPGSSTVSVPVEVRGLTVDRVGGVVTGISAGRVSGRVQGDRLPASWQVPLVRFANVEWAPGSGLTFGTELVAGASAVPMIGRVAVTAAGLDGTVVADAPAGGALVRLGTGAATLALGTARAAWPASDLRLDGRVLLFGQPANCQPLSLMLGRDAAPTPVPVTCDGATRLPLFEGSAHPVLTLGTAVFSVVADPRRNTATIEGAVSALVQLDSATRGGATPCGVRVRLAIAGDSAVAGSADDACSDTPRVVSGWLALTFSRLRLERLAWRRESGFDLRGLVDLQPAWRARPDAPLPYLADVALTRDGLVLPAQAGDVAERTIAVEGYQLQLARLALAAATWTWRDLTAGRTDAVRWTVNGRLGLGDAAVSCLREPVAFTDGQLGGGRLRVPLTERAFATPCAVPAGPVALDVSALRGMLGATLGDSTIVPDTLPGVVARVRWPTAWRCSDAEATSALTEALSLRGDGIPTGRVAVGTVGCPVPTRPIALRMAGATLEFAGSGTTRTAVLRGGAEARMPSGGAAAAQGTIGIDVGSATIVDGTLSIATPIRLGFPAVSPVLSFEVGGLTLSRDGAAADGRQALLLDGGTRLGATFVNVLFDTAGRVRRGAVRFDTTFAFVGPAQGQPIPWRAVSAGSPLTTSGARFDWAASVVLDSVGLHGAGASRGAVQVGDVRVRDATVVTDAAFAWDPATGLVRDGRAVWQMAGASVAVLDRDGLRLEGAAVARAALPERLPLPSLNGAYLELRRGDTTLVETQLLADGVRVRSVPGRPVTLVVPALAAAGAPPRVPVVVDLRYDGLYDRLGQGSLLAAEPAALPSRLDAASAGLPLAPDSLALSVSGGVTDLLIFGRPVLFGAARGAAHAMRIAIGGDGAAVLFGAAAIGARVPLVPQGTGAWYLVDSVSGRAERRSGVATADLSVRGRLELGNVGEARWRAPLALRLTEQGVQVGAMGVADSSDAALDAGGLRVMLSQVSVPRFAYTPSGFDFEFQLEGALRVTSIGAVTPSVRGLSLVPAGLAVPSVLVPELQGAPVTFDGWRVQARALRVRPGVLPIFGGTASATISADLALGFGRLDAHAPPELAEMTVSALDVAVRDGRLVGMIEPRDLATPLTVPLPQDAALRVRRVVGALTDSGGVQRVRLEASGTLRLAPSLRCAAGDTVSVGSGWRLDASARPVGTAPSSAAPCPIPLGGLRARLGAGTVRFDTSAAGATRAALEAPATVTLPSGARDSVRATGTLAIDLLRGVVTGGSVEIAQAFRVEVPTVSPALTFTVRQARLDSAGLVLQGSGDVVLPDGLAAPVAFDALAVDPADGRLRSGQATFPEGLGVSATLGGGGTLTWRTVAPSVVVTSALTGDGVRLRLPAGAVLTASGFTVPEPLAAVVRLGDERLEATAVPSGPDVRLGTAPLGVAQGRLVLRRGDTEVGVLDARGFTASTVFAARALPTRLALGDSTVGVLVLRDDTGPRVRTEASDTALHVFTASDATAPLVLPGLAPPSGGLAPIANARVDLWLDPRTFAPLRGTVVAEASPGGAAVATMAVGVVSAQVRRVVYGPSNTGYRLRADARLQLPPSFGGATIDLDTIALGPSGLAAVVERGRVSDTYDPALAPLASPTLGTGTGLDILGVRWSPGTPSTLTIAAAVTTPLFAGATRQGVYFTTVVGADGLRATLDQTALEARRFTTGRFAFQPTAFGGVAAAQLALSLDALTLTLRGTLQLPEQAPGFAVSVQDIRLGTAGLRVPGDADDAGPLPQDVRIFGGTMTVRRSTSTTAPALRLGWSGGVLTLRMSGTMPVLGRSTEVTGLALGSDGAMALESANGFTLVPALGAAGQGSTPADPVAAIRTISAADGQLSLAGRVVLPAPFRAQQGDGGDFTLRLGLDGMPSATRVTVWNQTEGCCDRVGRAMFPLGPMALVHARRLDLSLDVQDVGRSSVSLVGDAYVGTTDEARTANRIAFGTVNGSIVRPGLQVGFDGSVTLGNVALLREFTVGFQSLNLTIKSVAVPNTVTLSSAGVQGSGTPFAFVVAGGLSLNVARVSGSIGFQDVSIGTDGVKFAPTSLQAATLRIAGVLSVELNDLAIITRDTSVTIEPNDSTGTAKTVQVRNLVSFGGRLTLEGSGLSGGVDRFLFYQGTDGSTALLIRNASLTIPNTLEFRADFEFIQTSDGFEMSLGARGTLLQKVTVGMYGMVSQKESDGLRLGMFIRTTVEIPILPGVLTVAELGGGIFYRPREQDINGAWRAAGLDPSLRSIGGNVPANPSAGQGLLFAVMLYGRLDLVSGVASGRTLITITDRYFEILGEVTLLQRQNELVGTIRLQIGFTEAYAEGDIRIRVQLAGIITGNAQLAFFVYGRDTWGVIGSLNVRVLNFLSASGKLFIGPPGFLIKLEVNANFDVAVIKVRTRFAAAVWYLKAAGEVGGYAELSVRAEVFDGLATITATLRGAFLFRRGYSLLYASASVRVETFLGNFGGSVWVKVENGDVDGGLGRDKTMDRLVARAAQVEAQMTSAASEATQALTQARNVAATVSISREELAQAFARFQAQDEYYRTRLADFAMRTETNLDPPVISADWVTMRGQYANALAGQLQYEERVFLAQPRAPVIDSLSTALEATRQQIIVRLRATTAQIVELADAPFPAELEDPLTGDVPDSVTSTLAPGADGRMVKRIAAMPSFQVDPAKAAANVQRATAWMDLSRVSATQLRVAIDSMERSLLSVRILIEDRSDESFIRFAERYSRARESMEEYVVSSIATARLRLRHADTGVAVVRRLAPSLTNLVRDKTARQSNDWNRLASVVTARANILQQLGTPINTVEIASRFRTRDENLFPALRATSDSLGLALWVRLGSENLPAWRDTLARRLTALENGNAVAELEALRRGHAELSAAAASLFDAQGNLYSALLDAYESYTRSFFLDPVAESWQRLPMPTQEFLELLARRNTIRRLVRNPPRPPRVHTLAVEQPLYSRVRVDVDAQWPLTDAVFVAEEPANGPPGTSYLIGKARSAWFYVPAPSGSTTELSTPRAVRADLRVGSGYLLERRMPYDARFLPVGAQVATGRFTSSGSFDPTPPSAPTFSAEGGMEYTAAWGRFAGQRLLYVPTLDRLTMSWSVVSSSGASAWTIGVGTRPDSADILPLRDLAGRRSFTFTGLDAYAGAPIYLRGKAKSGDGVDGPFGPSLGIVRDTVAPRLGGVPRVSVPDPTNLLPSALPPKTMLLHACPATRSSAEARWFEPIPTPVRQIRFTIPDADRSAGVPASLAWRVDTMATVAASDSGWQPMPTLRRIDSNRLDFRRSWYLHVIARNPSGVASNVVTSAPVRLTGDRSPPTPPEFCQLATANGGLTLVPAAASRDLETEVAGYQFAVMRNGRYLKSFPEPRVVEVPASQWVPGQSVTVRTVTGPWALPPADADSAPVIVQVRAVNVDQQVSAISGAQVATTRLPPPTPVLSVSRERMTFGITAGVTVTITHAEASGTATPIYEVTFGPEGQPASWTTSTSNIVKRSIALGLASRWVLRVRIRAGNGLVSPVVSQVITW